MFSKRFCFVALTASLIRCSGCASATEEAGSCLFSLLQHRAAFHSGAISRLPAHRGLPSPVTSLSYASTGSTIAASWGQTQCEWCQAKCLIDKAKALEFCMEEYDCDAWPTKSWDCQRMCEQESANRAEPCLAVCPCSHHEHEEQDRKEVERIENTAEVVARAEEAVQKMSRERIDEIRNQQNDAENEAEEGISETGVAFREGKMKHAPAAILAKHVYAAAGSVIAVDGRQTPCEWCQARCAANGISDAQGCEQELGCDSWSKDVGACHDYCEQECARQVDECLAVCSCSREELRDQDKKEAEKMEDSAENVARVENAISRMSKDQIDQIRHGGHDSHDQSKAEHVQAREDNG